MKIEVGLMVTTEAGAKSKRESETEVEFQKGNEGRGARNGIGVALRKA